MVSSANPEKSNAIRHEYRALFVALSTILFEADPSDINYETNTDEYDSEVETIISRLKQAQSEEDVRRIIHEEFGRWFDAEDVGPIEAYGGIASKVWAKWQPYR